MSSTERPILFQDTMVSAILDGRKTVTRRVGPTWACCQAGDRLWVREAHALVDGPCWSGLPCVEGPDGQWAYYRTGFDRTAPRWRPSIHLPRWACRLHLEVVSVTEEQALLGGGLGQMAVAMPKVDDEEARHEGFANRAAFLDLWRRLHPDHIGPIYRVAFRRIEGVARG